jgi:aryl-alcohol dehydrogenase-like predicted oxidoreductase
MKCRTRGGSGCAVSAFALGTMTFGDSTDEAGAFAQLDAFAERGGTLVDTANVYVDGASEAIIGRWLADRPADITERMVVATKGRFPTSGEPNGAGLSRRHLDRTLDQLTANLPTGLQLSAEETALLDEVSAPRVDFPYGGAVAHQMTRQIEGGWPA